MSDFKAQPAAAGRDEAEASSSDEAGSSSAAAQKHESGKTPSFWSRAARIFRGANSASLREDLADALLHLGAGQLA